MTPNGSKLDLDSAYHIVIKRFSAFAYAKSRKTLKEA
jgi:hypothetical protein